MCARSLGGEVRRPPALLRPVLDLEPWDAGHVLQIRRDQHNTESDRLRRDGCVEVFDTAARRLEPPKEVRRPGRSLRHFPLELLEDQPISADRS